MAFIAPKEICKGKVFEVTIGTEKTAIFGGENVFPFHSFEGKVPHRPVIAYEIQDVPPDDWPETAKEIYKGVSNDPVEWAKYCQDELDAEAIAVRLVGTHPDGENRSTGEAVNTVKDLLASISIPLILLGSNHVEKDSSVLVAVSEAAKDRNCIIGKAQEGNYKTIAAAAMANNHKLIALSELDINLSKQLNILLTQMDFDKERLIIDPMSSALGYGFEYTYSVMERIRLAALVQDDITMQQPIIADVGMYVWKIKETQVSAAEIPQMGPLKERAIAWEAVTASLLSISGAELLIMRHPEAVKAVKEFMAEMM